MHWKSAHTHTHTSHTHTQNYTHTHNMHTYSYTNTHKRTQSYTHTHTRTHAHSRTHTHVHLETQFQKIDESKIFIRCNFFGSQNPSHAQSFRDFSSTGPPQKSSGQFSLYSRQSCNCKEVCLMLTARLQRRVKVKSINPTCNFRINRGCYFNPVCIYNKQS